MAKVESSSARPEFFAQGGKTKMFGKQHAGPAKAGDSTNGDKSGDGGEWAAGGKTKMFGKGHASPAVAGHTAKASQ